MTQIRRLLVANRGEIAVRIIRACERLGIEPVVVYSDADRDSLAVRMASRAVCIGPPPAARSYLSMNTILHAAIATACDAIHPGYGFLSERAEFASRCADEKLLFVGPSPEAIGVMGNKLAARKAAIEAGIPVLAGSMKISTADEARRLAADIGYPVLLKAAAGGGGRGMKIVRGELELDRALQAASAGAQAAFGDGTLYMERYIGNARHIEVQVFGDRHGNIVHVGERDCSLQRRHQKIVEEAPAPFVQPAIVERMRAMALTLARKVKYENAGTVEFIFDRDRNEFFFLEMNTRIQVEHPVTEMISGLDLVQEQIRVAAGSKLSVRQDDIVLVGHAMEARVNAETPGQDFRPHPGRIVKWHAPSDEGVRVDSHCFSGYVVPPYYDSMIAKVIAYGGTRLDAMHNLERALQSLIVQGIDTTSAFVRALLADENFRTGEFNTNLVESKIATMA
jgi:acetyl-CoA carboxylase biotin carboxylase subunit